MPDYARVQDGVVVAVGRLARLPADPDVVERVGGVPALGDTLEQDGSWTPAPEPEPPVQTTIDTLDFFERFTKPEQKAIFNAKKTSVDVEIFLEKLRLAPRVRLDHARTLEGVQAMADEGLIDPERVAEILEPVA